MLRLPSERFPLVCASGLQQLVRTFLGITPQKLKCAEHKNALSKMLLGQVKRPGKGGKKFRGGITSCVLSSRAGACRGGSQAVPLVLGARLSAPQRDRSHSVGPLRWIRHTQNGKHQHGTAAFLLCAHSLASRKCWVVCSFNAPVPLFPNLTL